MRCRSIAAGSATFASRCNRMPTCRCSRMARWAAAIERGRPIVIGSTMPGNRTVLRTGTITSASGGKGGDGAVVLPLLSSAAPKKFASTTQRLRLLQDDQEAAVGRGSPDRTVAPGRQPHAALEPSLRELEPMDDRGLQLGRKD